MRQRFFQGLLVIELVCAWLEPAWADHTFTGQAISNETPPDLVLLQDGGMVRGTIVESLVNEHVDIRLVDGQTRHFPWEDVKYAGPKEGTMQLAQSESMFSHAPSPPTKTLRPDTQWQLEFRIQLGLARSGEDLAMPWGGSVTFGQWFDQQRWYLGGIASLGQFVSMNLDSTGAAGNILNTDPSWANIGVEARYVFAHGTGSVSVDHGPPQPVGVRHWVGLATGAETFGVGDSNGGWGALEYGFDIGGSYPLGGVFSVRSGLDTAAVCPGAKPWYVDAAFDWRFYFNL